MLSFCLEFQEPPPKEELNILSAGRKGKRKAERERKANFQSHGPEWL